MAQINFTLNQEEILELLSENNSDGFRKLLESSLNTVLKAESQEQLQAAPYQRTEERTDSRNGFRDRELKTRIGTITLHVPRHRNQPFRTMVYENYSRSEAALVACMAEMVVNGVSTRKVSKVMATLCGTSYSKSTVSEVCKELSADVEAFRNRPLEGKYPFLVVDATYFRVREKNRIVSKALMIALAVNEEGQREIIGFSAYPNETNETWTDFLEGLKTRGLKDVLMITSDAHNGLIHALGKVFPDVPWQRCQFHFSRNISEKMPKKYQTGIRTELHEMFNAESIEEARKIRDRIIADYHDVAESAMECLELGFESSMTVMTLPMNYRRHFRTSNNIERLNGELKRRYQPIRIFPNEESMLRLMGSVLIEQNSVYQSGRRFFTAESYQALKNGNTREVLKKIAIEQQALLAA